MLLKYEVKIFLFTNINQMAIGLFSSLRVKATLYMFESVLSCEDQNHIPGFYNNQGGKMSGTPFYRTASSGRPQLFLCGFGLFIWFTKRTTRK